jgi:hypothetical protein
MNSDFNNSAKSSSLRRGTLYVWVLAVMFALGALPVWAQNFSSGSDGTDGPYTPAGAPGTVIIFDPTQFRGSQVAANIFNFTTITIPQGVTVKLSGNTLNGPVFWLAQGDVDIEELTLAVEMAMPLLPSHFFEYRPSRARADTRVELAVSGLSWPFRGVGLEVGWPGHQIIRVAEEFMVGTSS